MKINACMRESSNNYDNVSSYANYKMVVGFSSAI